MRPGFHRNLESYNELAQDFQQLDIDKSGELVNEDIHYDALEAKRVILDHALKYRLEKAAEQRQNPQETQEQIFIVQQEKQRIMAGLKREIANLDQPDYQAEKVEGAREVVFDDGHFLWKKEGGVNQEITIGDIITDLDWGIEYYFNQNIPRNIRKRYLIEKAKSQLQALLDQQILLDESSSSLTETNRKKIYQMIIEDTEAYEEDRGIIAEKIVRNFLRKIVFDNQDAGFDILEADIFEDVEQKIDFIIRRKKRIRGVGVEEIHPEEKTQEETKTYGIQFTLTQSHSKLKRKKQQLKMAVSSLSEEDRVEDILLVRLPKESIVSAYETWLENSDPGGPDHFYDLKIKREIFRGILKGIFSSEEIRGMLENLKI